MNERVCLMNSEEWPELRCGLLLNHEGPHRAHVDGEGEYVWGAILPSSPVDKTIPASADISAHERVLARAANIVADHTSEHGELWKEADATELGAMARHKANRVNYAARRYQEGKGKDEAKKRIVDSALDGINYLAFIVQLVEANDVR